MYNKLSKEVMIIQNIRWREPQDNVCVFLNGMEELAKWYINEIYRQWLMGCLLSVFMSVSENGASGSNI